MANMEGHKCSEIDHKPPEQLSVIGDFVTKLTSGTSFSAI